MYLCVSILTLLDYCTMFNFDIDLFVSSVSLGLIVTCICLSINGYLRCKHPVKTLFCQKKSTSVYVAGAWKHRKDMHQIMQNLNSLGYRITRWWASDDENELRYPKDYMRCSALGLQGIELADTVIAFLTDPEYEYKGTFTEIGYGLGMDKRIIIVCDGICEKTDHDAITFSHTCMNNVFFLGSYD